MAKKTTTKINKDNTIEYHSLLLFEPGELYVNCVVLDALSAITLVLLL